MDQTNRNEEGRGGRREQMCRAPVICTLLLFLLELFQ